MATKPVVGARIAWHELIAPDVKRALPFYTQLLGWEIEVWKPGEADYPMIRVDGRNHGGFLQLARPPHWLMYVEVEDADEIAARVPALGGRVFHAPETIEGVGRYTVVGDPQGAVFAARTTAEPAEPAHGVFVWDELLTTDVDGAASFYRALLGWTTRAEMDAYTIFEADENRYVAGMMAKPEQVPVPNWFSYVGVDDIERVLARVVELGGVVVGRPMEVAGVGWYAVAVDPVGAAIGVHQAA